jgi:hypothetical protein
MIAMSQKNRGRLILLGLVLVFVIPIMIAQWWVQSISHRLEQGDAVHLSALHSDFLGPVRLEQWWRWGSPPAVLRQGKWTLMVWAPHVCEVECLHALALTQRMQLALGRYAWRIQRVLVVPSPPHSSLDTYGHVEQLIVPGELERSPWPNEKAVYLVDGRGQLVLRYRPGIDPDGFMADVRRLVAHSG